MPRRQPYRSPDGADWRDPDMPLVRNYLFSNGTVLNTVDKEFEQAWRARCMEMNAASSWRNDPTYHSKRKETK